MDFGLSKNLTDRLRAWYDTWDAENLYESGWSSPDNFPADTGCVCMKPINIGKPSLLDGKDDGRRFLKGSFGEVNEGAPPLPPDQPAVLATREHRRFTEFADTVRAHRYIGLCWVPPGVGKTLSARHYAAVDWDTWQEISFALDYAEHGVVDPYVHTESRSSGRTRLLIIDEADRLKATGLEQVRDYYHRHTMGLILIGMPGIEKRLARYPQLYSRIGFAHEYRPLNPDELSAVLAQRLPVVRESTDEGLAHAAAVATIVRITGGNFRLVDRLLTQIKRIQTLNNLDALSPEVVNAARETLIIGH